MKLTKTLFLTAILIAFASVSFATMSTLTFKGGLSRPETDIEEEIQLGGMLGMSYEVWLAKWLSFGINPYLTKVQADEDAGPNFESALAGGDLLLKIRPNWKYVAPWIAGGAGAVYFYPKTIDDVLLPGDPDHEENYAFVAPTVSAGLSFFTGWGIDFDLGVQKNMMLSDYLDGINDDDKDDSYWMAWLGISHTFGKTKPVVITKAVPQKMEPMLTVSQSQINQSDLGGSQSVQIASNLDWTAQASDTWIGINPSSGKGDTSLTMSFAPNDNITPRNGKILITGGGFNRIINVQQDGRTNHLSVTPSVNQVSNQAGIAYYSVEATSDWKAMEDAEWFSISPDKGTGNGQIMVTFRENKANAIRVGQILITSGELSQTISLTQDRTTPPPIPVERNVILKGVNFRSGSAELTEDSFVILDEAAASLAFYPDVEVEIQGHTDSTGSLALNTRLSLARAEAVKTYLINKGIADNRMTVKGFGPASPIAPNDTADGRAQNRRIEFSRTK